MEGWQVLPGMAANVWQPSHPLYWGLLHVDMLSHVLGLLHVDMLSHVYVYWSAPTCPHAESEMWPPSLHTPPQLCLHHHSTHLPSCASTLSCHPWPNGMSPAPWPPIQPTLPRAGLWAHMTS